MTEVDARDNALGIRQLERMIFMVAIMGKNDKIVDEINTFF
jgi:hypothetical protein